MIDNILLSDLPASVTLLPNDWEGETTRATLKFAVSRQAVNNKKFDVYKFIKLKFNNALTAIRHRRGINELHLTRRIRVAIDAISDQKKIQIYIYIEYAKEELLVKRKRYH